MAGFFVLSGTRAVSAPEIPPLPELPSYTVSMTAYNALPGQTDEDPFTTASGLYSNPEIIAARSRDLAKELPFGTVIAVSYGKEDDPNCGFHKVKDKIGYRVVGDVMHARMVNKIDLLLDHKDTVTLAGMPRNPARVFGMCKGVDIQVVGYIDLKNVPKTQAELAAMVEKSRAAEAKVAAGN